MSVADPYALLEVSRDASADEIKSSYRKLARKYHPDVNPDNPEAEEKFKELSQAYAILSDPEKKAQFDRFGSVEDIPSGADFSSQVDLSDLFDAFFGGSGGFGGGGGARRRSNGVDGEDLRADASISLIDVLTGSDYPISYKRMAKCGTCNGSRAAEGSSPKTCESCHGQGSVTKVQDTFIGRVQTSTTCPACRGEGKIIENPCGNCNGRGLEVVEDEVSIKIPPGIEDGMTLRISGKGSDGLGAGVPGDLYVMLHVEADERFSRQGENLYTDINLTYPQVALGDRVTVEGLTDEIELEVKPGTQPGHEFRLKGEGLPRLHGGARGSLYARVNLAVPKKSNDAEGELLREYARETGGPIPQEPSGGILDGIFGKKGKKKKK